MRLLARFIFVVLGAAPLVFGGDPAAEAIVIYNKSMPESKDLAEFYAERRLIPADRVVGFSLPKTETMTRSEFEDDLEKPLLKWLEKRDLFKLKADWKKNLKDESYRPVAESKIRYAILCYGVPLKILHDPKIKESGTEQLAPQVQRNDAAVDSELSILPLAPVKPRLTGPFVNPVYSVTNASLIHPGNGVLMVARLDGPTVAIARGLVEKALQAERDGLWGRAYFDARGFTNGDYKMGDDWIRGGTEVTRQLGMDTILDNNPATISANYPMSQIAIYAGWYDADVSGPFARPNVEFMPGAFAYHLHSFSAQTIRSTNQHWVGPLLAKGATATMGCVEEPFLQGTPNVHAFLGRWILLGFTFGEAAYACQASLSWQTTVVGDPLYRPFGRNPMVLHEELQKRKSPLLEWSHTRVVGWNLVRGMKPGEGIAYIRDVMKEEPELQKSALLHEKTGDLYQMLGGFKDAVAEYRKAIAANPSPQQRIRLVLMSVQILNSFGLESEAYDVLKDFVKTPTDYPDLANVYKSLISIAEKLKKTEDVEEFQRELAKLK